MKIDVLPRMFFERIKGQLEEIEILQNTRVISINSSRGWDAVPPFSEKSLKHPNLLCQIFDDVTYTLKDLLAIDPKPNIIPSFFTDKQAQQIFQFVNQQAIMPVVIHCTAGISRSGAVGEVLNIYFNHYQENNLEDQQYFLENNRQIMPNPLVKRILMRAFALCPDNP